MGPWRQCCPLTAWARSSLNISIWIDEKDVMLLDAASVSPSFDGADASIGRHAEETRCRSKLQMPRLVITSFLPPVQWTIGLTIATLRNSWTNHWELWSASDVTRCPPSTPNQQSPTAARTAEPQRHRAIEHWLRKGKNSSRRYSQCPWQWWSMQRQLQDAVSSRPINATHFPQPVNLPTNTFLCPQSQHDCHTVYPDPPNIQHPSLEL